MPEGRRSATSHARSVAPRRRAKSSGSAPNVDVERVIGRLRRLGDAKTRAGLARFGLPAERAFGVPMHRIQALAKELGRNHALALALWRSGFADARSLAVHVAEPERLTADQMERWARDFDSWGACDTACFALFDRTPHAFAKVRAWASREREFEKRAAFALLAGVALHRKELPDAPFLRCLPLCERAAADERNFVKKGVSWALRTIGHRSVGLHAAVVEFAERLAVSPDAAPRWVGKDVLRDLRRPLVAKRLAARPRKK